jgi:valyl-tRNA synthetase
MIAPYPKISRRRVDGAAERAMGVVMDLVTAVRNIRGEMRISPAVLLDARVRPGAEHAALLAESRGLIEALARCRLTVDPRATRPAGSALAVVGPTEIYVALAGVVDLAAERSRLEKEIKRIGDTVGFLEAKLARPEFVERAPAAVVDKERARLEAERQLQAKLEASLAWIAEGTG